MSQGRVSDNISDQSEPSSFLYDVYTFNKDPETKLSPWQKFCTHKEIMAAQQKAQQLHKSQLYERIEVLQRCPVNSNYNCKTVKVYKKGDWFNSKAMTLFLTVTIAALVSFIVTYFLL